MVPGFLFGVVASTPELMRRLQYRIEYTGQGVPIDLANGRDRNSRELRYQFDISTAGEVPRDSGMAQGVRRYLTSLVVCREAGHPDGGFEPLPDAAYLPSMMFNHGMP